MLHPNDARALNNIIRRGGIRDVVAALADWGFAHIGNTKSGTAEYVYHRMAETRAGIESHIAAHQLAIGGVTDCPNAKPLDI